MPCKKRMTALALAMALTLPNFVLAQEIDEEPLMPDVQISSLEVTGETEKQETETNQSLAESQSEDSVLMISETETEKDPATQAGSPTEGQTEAESHSETETESETEADFALPDSRDLKDFLSQAKVDSVTRLAGTNRYNTAVEISRALFKSAKLVILASGETYPDALAGSSLSKASFPILLTEKTVLPDRVKIELARLKPQTILILGGPASISEEIEKNLQKDFETLRLAGENRYETAVEIAKLVNQDRLLVASGENFPDALAATALAGVKDQTVLLTGKDQAPQVLLDYLLGQTFERIDFAGGQASISEATATAILEAGGNPDSDRYAGSNRAATSVQLAQALKDRTGNDPYMVIIATGESFPDALAASAIAQSQLAPILLVEKDYVDQEVIDYLDANRATIQKAVVIGGEGTVSADVANLVQASILDGGEKPALLTKDPGQTTPSETGKPDPDQTSTTPAPSKPGAPLASIPPYPGQQKRGSSGQAVKDIQAALAKKGYYAGAIDGSFGALTETAVKQFQKENGLEADGSVGKETWNKLMGSEVVDTGDKRQQIVLEGPYVSQLSPVYAPVGCEAASLLMGLKYKGYALDVDLREFLDKMPKHDSNPAKGFVGNPYKSAPDNKRTTIYPPKLAEYGREYGKVRDISGFTPDQLVDELYKGRPVVVYVTLFWKKPYYRDFNIEGEWQSLLRNNHALLLDGYDPATGKYHVSDPYNHEKAGADRSKSFRYWVDKTTFEDRYNVRKHAVVIE